MTSEQRGPDDTQSLPAILPEIDSAPDLPDVPARAMAIAESAMPISPDDAPSTSDSMEAPLSLCDRKRGIRTLHILTFVNSLSWLPFLGTLTTMYLLRFNATNVEIGLKGSLIYVSLPLGLLGAILAEKIDRRKLAGVTWILRALFVSSLIFVPYVAGDGTSAHRMKLAVWFGLGGLILFTLVRAVGSVAYLSILRGFVPGDEATRVQSSIQAFGRITAILFSLFMAYFIGESQSVFRFQILFGIGVVAGFISGGLFFTLPRPIVIKRPAVSDAYAAAWDRFRRRPVILFTVYQAIFIMCLLPTRSFIDVMLRKSVGWKVSHILLLPLIFFAGSYIASIWMKYREQKTELRPMLRFNTLFGFATTASAMLVAWLAWQNETTADNRYSIAMLAAAVLFFGLYGAFTTINILRTNTLILQIAPDRAPTTFLTLFQISKTVGAIAGGIGFGHLLDVFRLRSSMHSAFPFLELFGISTAVMLILSIVNLVFPLPKELYPKKRRPTGLHARRIDV